MSKETDLINGIKSELPKDAQITDSKFEGASVVLFTKNKKFFTASSDIVKLIAKKFKKRIDVRSDPSVLLPPEEAKEKIKSIIPKEVTIANLSFETHACKVLIEADRPGLVIGKGGSTLAQIKKETLWSPEIFRTPPMKSEIIETIRHTLIKQSKERAIFLDKLGKRVYDESKPPSWIRVTALGGFREVGRSCLFVQTPESRILLDCGVNIANEEHAFPFLEAPEFDISKLDAVVITHAHLDHSGLLPLLFKYGYTGPVYCTTPTRALMALLQLDYIDVVTGNGKKAPYSSKDIRNAILHTVTLNYEEVTDITPDIRITLYNAGHIIGSASVHLHVGEGLHNIVYSGDIKYAPSRLLEPANNHYPRCETLFLEATYGLAGDIQPKRSKAETQIVEIIKKTIERGGKVLVPVLGVGRSQELMLILEDLTRRKLLPEISLYLDGMLWDATAVHTTYPEFLSNRVKKMIFSRDQNPLLAPMFKRVGSRREREEIINGPPCVIMATSGMLVGGPSVEYLKRLCDDKRNSLIFINYQGEGSLGKRLQKGWKEVPIAFKNGRKEVARAELEIHTVEGFSAHADRNELMNFVGQMRNLPNTVVVGHGENSKCLDLAKSIHRAFRIETLAPRNLETIRLS